MPNFSGKWNLQGQLQGIKQGDWTGITVEQLELYAWGVGDQGRLGDDNGANHDVLSPIQIGSLQNWSQVGAGQEHSSAIKTDGTLWVWGRNEDGEIGDNTSGGDANSKSSPVQIGSETNWADVDAGRKFTFAITTEGELYSWGKGNYGATGQNDSVERSSPTQVGALTNWSSVEAGTYECLAIKTDGTLWAWGDNRDGQLAQNDRTNRSSPVQIGALTNWSQVSVNVNRHCFAIKTDGTLWAWGGNGFGQLGVGDTSARSSPVQIGALTNWSQVSAINSAGSAINSTGELYTWGAAQYFGRTGQNNTVNLSSPTQVGALTNWSQVFGGGASCFSIKTDGTLWAWGYNNSGRLGDGTTVNKSSPVQIGSLTTWSQISIHNAHVLGIVDNSYRTGMPS